jgi:hypothetical protein
MQKETNWQILEVSRSEIARMHQTIYLSDFMGICDGFIFLADWLYLGRTTWLAWGKAMSK